MPTMLSRLLRLRRPTLANKRVWVLIGTMVASGSVVAAAPRVALGASGPGAPAVAAKLTRCHDSQMAVTAAELPGVAVSGGIVVRYRNLSPYACTLSGYPTVVGLVSPTGPVQAAADVVSGGLGGWQPSAVGVQKPLPTVVVSAKGGVASSVVEFVDGATTDTFCPSKRYPLWLHSLWLNVPGGTRPFALAVSSMSIIVCSHFEADPIVPGTTGTALQ
jgi:hypothetical protein